jgi:hypothetical protein
VYDRRPKELQQAYGEAMLELRARKKLESLLGTGSSFTTTGVPIRRWV